MRFVLSEVRAHLNFFAYLLPFSRLRLGEALVHVLVFDPVLLELFDGFEDDAESLVRIFFFYLLLILRFIVDKWLMRVDGVNSCLAARGEDFICS